MKLFITVLFGFIIPWVIGTIIYFKDNRVIILIAPFSCALAFIFNDLGIALGYFHPSVYNFNPYLLTEIMNIGLFTIEPCVLIFAKRHTRMKTIYLLVLITIFASSIDLILFLTSMLIFEKGWSVIWSVIWFFITFNIVYLYYLLLKKLNIFQ